MTTTYFYKQTTAPRALRSYTGRRLARELERMHLSDAKVRVTFDQEAESHRIKCELDDGHGIHVVASGIDPDIFAAVDEAVERITRQVGRERSKRQTRRYDQIRAPRWLSPEVHASVTEAETYDS